MIGICPQFNVQFEVLTVKENLKTFAEIKGIESREVQQEVSVCSPERHQQQHEAVGKHHISVKTLHREAQRVHLAVSADNRSWCHASVRFVGKLVGLMHLQRLLCST